jgi:hypothetical protein
MSSISSVTSTQPLNNISHRKTGALQTIEAQASAVLSPGEAGKTTISTEARELSATQSNSSTPSGNNATADFDTAQGLKKLNIDNYFTPGTHTDEFLFQLPPLLLPSQKNIDALTKHISATLPRFLAENNIPSAPASVTYNNEGKIQLPSDYHYASEFKQALANNPTIARELSTVSALNSHVVEMKKATPFQTEYAATTTPAEASAVVAKYSYLFSGNHHYDTIVLHFSPSGSLSLTSDGEF